ncbi:dentin sialophosphoprotein-like protein [Thalictrum thalictroides]|uniref:Dentin sialophosphoprotein-like protein n=1 Tax=Thalictrum thalictroides TaxID=46969 RepID=A0A7J6X662_THATH|nr:dentin sialophosphoprotein-like protein [Thalictrum thalictroides]
MPGNEAADKVYNFFEQPNSQIASVNFPVVSNNLWLETRDRLGQLLTLIQRTTIYNQVLRIWLLLHSKFFLGVIVTTSVIFGDMLSFTKTFDSGSKNDKPSPQTHFNTNNAQLALRPEFTRGQFSNQEPNLNGFTHEQQSFQNRQSCINDQLKVASRGLSIIGQLQGNAREQSPALARTSERLETAEAPISFDLLKRKQQFMSNQQPGMSQPQPRQQSGLSDMPLWQQQVMFKQLQEFQRQKQLQQMEHAGRHQNQINQMSAFAKQAANDQLPAIVNGMPIHGSTGYPWQNDLGGGDSKVPSSSQMFMVGNTNWAQRGGYSGVQGIPDGLLSNEQVQILRAMGSVPQQLDQSAYGAHNGLTRGAFNQYSHLQGIPQDCADTISKGTENHFERPIMQSMPVNNSLQGGQSSLFSNQVSMHDGTSVSGQGYHGKNLYGHIPFQGASSVVQPVNHVPTNSLSGNASVQAFQGREQLAGWSGNVQQRAAGQAGSSQGLVSLDPTEKKILFSSDDNIWDGPGGKGGATAAGGYGDSLESVEQLNAFPSLQSGTWSALMQSAVAEASSSDTGLQDEWSGLSFSKRELSTVDQSLTQSDSAKQQTDWADNNLHSAPSLTSRPFHLFDDGKSQRGGNASDFQQSHTQNLYEESERMQHDASYETIQHSLKNNGKWLDCNSQQKTLMEGSHQVQPPVNSENIFQSSWTRQNQSESATHATNVALDAHNMQSSWIHQHKTPSHNINSQHCNNTAAWNVNKSLSGSGDALLKISETDNREHRFQGNDLKMGMHVDRDRSGLLMVNSSNFADGGGSHQVRREASFMNNCSTTPNSSDIKGIPEANQQVLSGHPFNYRKQMVGSPANHRGDDGRGYNQNQLGSPVLDSSIYTSDRVSGETYDKRQDNCYQKEFSNDSYNSNQSQPTVTGGGLRENSWLSTSDSRPMASANQKSQSGRKSPMSNTNQYHPMGSMDVDLEASDTSKRFAHMKALSQQAFQGTKGHAREYVAPPDFNAHTFNSTIAMEKEHVADFQGTEKGSASSDGSAGSFPQNRRTVQTCQNMLELFHKVDQSVEHGTPGRFSSSDRNTSSVMPEAEDSDPSVARQWHNQSTTSQGCALRLAPPSERLPFTNQLSNAHNSHTVSSLNSRQVDSKVDERGQIRSPPASSLQSLPHEISQRERWDNTNPNISGQITNVNETSRLNMQASISPAFTSSGPFLRNQLQSQQMSRGIEKVLNNPPPNISNDGRASLVRQTHGTYGEVMADQSAKVSLPGTTSRNSFAVSPREDASQPESSNWSQARVSGQPFPVLESVPVSRPSAMSSKSNQGDFSMLHHVWANMSAQQHLAGGAPHKGIPQSSPSNSNLERNSIDAHQLEHGDTKKGANCPETGVGLTNSQHVRHAEGHSGIEGSWKHIPADKVDPTPPTGGASQEQAYVTNHQQGTKSVPSSLGVHHNQQEVDRGRYGKDPSLVSQRESLPVRSPATSARDIEAFGRSLRQGQNYSLLHQMQAMKSVENDLDKRGGKRFKGADSDADAQQLASQTGQQLQDGSKAMIRDSLNSGSNSTVQPTSFRSADGKMFSFSPNGRGDQNAASHNVLGAPSLDVATFGQNDSLNRSSQLRVSSIRTANPQINPKMAPTWFDRYGTFRTEQSLPMQDAQNTVRPIPQQLVMRKGPEGLDTNRSNDQVNAVDTSQIGDICQSAVTTMVHSENSTHLQSLPSEVSDQALVVMRPKKRKSEISMLVPWNKEVMQGSHRLQTISMAEQDWAQAANRLVEKLEDDAELADDTQTTIRPRRRLIFTTQLMQQLFCPAPAEILSAKADSDYETVAYSVAKLALGEACSLISSSGGDSVSSIVDENRESGKLKPTKKMLDQYFSTVVDEFIGRAKKVETDLLRLDKRASVMDIRVECQDLERFSVINRFAKFHGRGQADAGETSSSSNATAALTQRTCPQRYVTAHAMPRNLPGGVQCLSL